jgi:hypothetical protein
VRRPLIPIKGIAGVRRDEAIRNVIDLRDRPPRQDPRDALVMHTSEAALVRILGPHRTSWFILTGYDRCAPSSPSYRNSVLPQ